MTHFQDTFNWMPLCGYIGGRILCMHGGLSPHLNNLDQLRNLPRPIDPPNPSMEIDLLWWLSGIYMVIRNIEMNLRYLQVRSGSVGKRLASEHSWCVLYIWARCCCGRLPEVGLRFDCTGSSSSTGWLWILCQSTSCYHFFSTTLLWTVWQCRWYDVHFRRHELLFPGT